MEFNNPALRLYNLLDRLRRANPNVSTREVLANVFDVPEAPKELFHAIVQFHELTNEVVAFAINKTLLPPGPLQRYMPQIQSAVDFTNLDAPWHHYVNRITVESMLVLEMVAQTGGIQQDVAPSPEVVEDLHVKLDELFEFVFKSNELDKEFRAYVLQQIEQIRRCLAEYRISGAQGFVKYLQLLIIQTQFNADAIKRQESKNSEPVSRLKVILGGVKKIVALTESGVALLKKVKAIHSDVTPLLEDFSAFGGGEIPEVNTEHAM